MNVRATIDIRDLESAAEIRAAEELQKEAWGMDDRDVVPMFHLIAVREAGGVLIGAFDGAELVGFAYGFIGLEGGRTTLHSHMLGVKPAYRNYNLGYRLKLVQRERALANGLTLMTWTFDPLQSLNAHFNLGKLGVVSEKYRIDFYGDASTSFLHRTGTDRLWVSWPLNSERVRRRIADGSEASPLLGLGEVCETMLELGENDAPIRNSLSILKKPPAVMIEIPRDIIVLQQREPELAISWREATRWAFTEALAAGYLVEEFYRMEKDGRHYGAYLLSAGKRVADIF